MTSSDYPCEGCGKAAAVTAVEGMPYCEECAAGAWRMVGIMNELDREHRNREVEDKYDPSEHEQHMEDERRWLEQNQ